MLATFQSAKPGITEAQLVEHLRLEQSHRGLTFDYALVASGLTFGKLHLIGLGTGERRFLGYRRLLPRLSCRHGAHGGHGTADSVDAGYSPGN